MKSYNNGNTTISYITKDVCASKYWVLPDFDLHYVDVRDVNTFNVLAVNLC